MLLTILVLFVLIVLVFGIGSHYKNAKQYQKKQQADAQLFKQVIHNLQDHDQLQEAIEKHGIENTHMLHKIKKYTQLPVSQAAEIKILSNGEETYKALFEAIEHAKHHIHLLFYTVQPDQVGQRLTKLLVRKAQQGVKVRLLVDGVGSSNWVNKVEKQLKQYRIDVGVFAPPKIKFIFHLNYRNHRKIAIIDGKVGFTGGLNLGKEYLHQDPQKGFWRDLHCRVQGDTVLLLQRIFATDWYYTMKEQIAENDSYFPNFNQQLTQDEQQSLVQVVPSGPDMQKHVIKNIYKEMILSAKERIWLTTPYFVPDSGIVQALKKQVRNGVDVRVIVPKKTDNVLVQAAAYYYYQQLAQAGVKIYLYQKGFYHAKAALVDKELTKIGSANMDRRSFHYSFEAGLFIYDSQTNATLTQLLEQDLAECTLLKTADLAKRSLWQRTATYIAMIFAPLL